MAHRLALAAASGAAALILAAGFVLVGFAPRATPVDAGGPVADTAAPVPPRIQVDTVYVAPPAQPQDVTITRVVKTSGHGDDEGEGGDDD